MEKKNPKQTKESLLHLLFLELSKYLNNVFISCYFFPLLHIPLSARKDIEESVNAPFLYF